ncbi:Hypothetical predicted protein [Mytilus galloprovincialis]|uniref:Fibrinogen C-terminal domain-containing protein n=1 Tax=Mytilus galloprovincialis TaxID=29158 RepID=A0A8B6GDE0_MYTGA|nr:Hypothetical predicted protein [Mytilus galloprovincialis]
MLIGLSLLLLVFTTGFEQYDCAAICFSCTEMLEDDKCQHITTCQDNEVCFIQKYRTADNRRLYDVGCTHNQLCPVNSTAVAFGRRTVDHSHIMCHECCDGNVCNSAFTCDDHVKPKLLDCLSCGGAVDVQNCSTSTTCEKDEVCFIQKYRTSANKELFDLGCKRSTMCLNRNPSNTFGRRTEEERHLLCEFCCTEGSLCNRNLDCGHTQNTYPSECADISFQKDGVYNVYPNGASYPKPAYCVIRNGIKWTIIHRRYDGSVDFNRTWEEYKQGFGNVTGEYWLGNEAIHLISTSGKHKLHIDLELRDGRQFYADYSLFKLNSESSQYLLNVTGYNGTAGDGMDKGAPEWWKSNGARFSTRDRGTDQNCAINGAGGWWYVACSISNLNGNFTKEYGILQLWNINHVADAGVRLSEMMITKY